MDARSYRLYLVDANETFRAGLRAAIAAFSPLSVVAEAATSAEAIAVGKHLQADLVVVDVNLSDGAGTVVARELLHVAPANQILLISSFDWDVHLAAAWVVGAVGFAPKSLPTTELVQMIWAGVKGPQYTPQQLLRLRAWDRAIGDRLQTLTGREWRVLGLVASGQSNRDIAQTLRLSENTVEKHLASLLQKLGATSRTALLALILRFHLDQAEGMGPAQPSRSSDIGENRHTNIAENRHTNIAENRHTNIAENRYIRMAENRQSKMAEFRDDILSRSN